MNSPSPNGFLFLLRSGSPPQTKYFNSPKFSLLIILLSSSPQCTKYFPSPNFSPPFPSLVFSSSSMGTKYFLFQIISSPSFSVLFLLFYCQHLHNKDWNVNKIFALVTWPSLDIFVENGKYAKGQSASCKIKQNVSTTKKQTQI